MCKTDLLVNIRSDIIVNSHTISFICIQDFFGCYHHFHLYPKLILGCYHKIQLIYCLFHLHPRLDLVMLSHYTIINLLTKIVSFSVLAYFIVTSSCDLVPDPGAKCMLLGSTAQWNIIHQFTHGDQLMLFKCSISPSLKLQLWFAAHPFLTMSLQAWCLHYHH